MDNPIRVLIVDDEPLAREGLRAALTPLPGLVIEGECRDGLEAVEAIRTVRPDAVFLDVQMPGLSGLEVAAALEPDVLPAIVFVTAYDEYAVRAFEVNAVDYLLKPYDAARVQEAVMRLRQRASKPSPAMSVDLHELLRRFGGQEYAERFVVPSTGRIEVVTVSEVDWIEAAGNYVQLHTGGRRVLLRETIKSVEARLDPRRFARVHRSALVNLGRVRELKPLPSGDYAVLLQDGAAVPMSRTYRDDVLRRLG